MIPVLLGFLCGAITTFCIWVMCSLLRKSSDYSAEITIDVLSGELEHTTLDRDQLRQSLIETGQALRERDDVIAELKRKAFYTTLN
jgi:hypothetical protein